MVGSIIRKSMIIFYFILFIILNIFDFLNILGPDLDFFKKLLSWTIISYIVYKTSPTKIFLGIRSKIYDFLLIIFYFMISVVKSLIQYLTNIDFSTFIVFSFLLEPLKLVTENYQQFLIDLLFFLGVIGVIGVSILILTSKSVEKDSLLGSFNLDENSYFQTISRFVLLIIVSLFFGIVIFNYFIEWFALAIDSFILIIGLLFYSAKFILHHTQSRFSIHLDNVGNFGNNVYVQFIRLFHNKKTFFIGLCFLLIYTLYPSSTLLQLKYLLFLLFFFLCSLLSLLLSSPILSSD